MTRRRPPLVLGSSSPRRRDLLLAAGIAFEVLPADLDERAHPGEEPEALVERLAREKALVVAAQLAPGDTRPVLAADTIVVLGGDVLGKPTDAADAVRLLTRLLGRTHRVLTGVAVASGRPLAVESFVEESAVTMREAAEVEVRAYVETGEPLDKAGAYAAQGAGRRFIERIEGSETAVIGLPMEPTLQRLLGVGIAPERAADGTRPERLR